MMKKRIWAYLLTLVMVVGLFPVSVLAEDGMLVATEASEENGDVVPVEEDMESFQMQEVGKTEVSTEAELREAIENAEGTKDNPTVIWIKDVITVSSCIGLKDKNIKLVGIDSKAELKAAENFAGGNLINMEEDGSTSLILENIIVNANSVQKNQDGLEEKRTLRTLAVRNGATLIMKEGAVVTGGAEWGGGIFIPVGGTVIIDGGTVTQNMDVSAGSDNSFGAGVLVNGGTLRLKEGSISNNLSTDGGAGVMVSKGEFYMQGGNISENISKAKAGGGVRVSGNGKFYMSDGIITENRSKNEGGGVFYSESEQVYLSGSVKIFDNYKLDGTKDDITTMANDHGFVIEDSIERAVIGTVSTDTQNNTVAVGAKNYTITEKDLKAIYNTKSGFALYLDKAENKIKSAKAITVTFNSNTDESETATQTVPFEIPTNLKENSFTKKDYTFTGWNTEKDGTGTPYEDGAEVSFSENTTLFAQWEEKKAVDVKIIADRDFMKGKGTVNFTVTTEPEEALSEVAVSCEHSDIDVTKNGDGTYSAYLPNRTETYTFVAEIKDSDYKDTYAECTVNVQKKKKSSSSDSSSGTGSSATEQEHSVSKADGIDNGKVKTDPAKAEKGDKVTVTVTPDEGYVIDRVVVKDADGKKIELTEKGEGKYTFTMPDSKVEIDAKFVKAEAEPAAPEEIPAAEKIVLTINERVSQVFGNAMVNDVAPVIRGERTMLPIRFIAQALGAEVAWDDALNKVTITKEDGTIELYIGSPVAVVNGENIELDAPAFIESSRTYLPLRFVAEHLGAKVLWDAETQQVTILPQP